MTLPDERTRAVANTRDFLFNLLDPRMTPRVPREVREQASRCLRHYPGTYDLIQASNRAPEIWGKPDAH